jgi:biopolymer transport protein ExbD
MASTLPKARHQAGVDMTPMLDIVFIMLIFFIVTASFVKETGLVVNRPLGSPPVTLPKDPTSIAFQIDANSRYFYDGHLIDNWGAEAIIKQRHTESPELPVVIKLESGARHGSMVRLYDIARKAGMPRGSVAVVN